MTAEPVAMTEYEARAAAEDWGLGYCWKAVRDQMVRCGGWRMVEAKETHA